jgi:hypothetical protein
MRGLGTTFASAVQGARASAFQADDIGSNPIGRSSFGVVQW